MILDFIGGDYAEKNIKLLAEDGRMVIIGFLKFVSTFSYKAFAIYRIALAVVVALLLICGVLHPTEVVAAA